jgi:hypothetical protein
MGASCNRLSRPSSRAGASRTRDATTSGWRSSPSPSPDERWTGARPGRVSRCRTSSAEWHIMSLSTPPPCKSPCQNQGVCGPLCSSAARAR